MDNDCDVNIRSCVSPSYRNAVLGRFPEEAPRWAPYEYLAFVESIDPNEEPTAVLDRDSFSDESAYVFARSHEEAEQKIRFHVQQDLIEQFGEHSAYDLLPRLQIAVQRYGR